MEEINSRREFVKNIGRLSAAGLFLSSLPLISCAAQSKSRLGVALVGLGNYSTTVLSRALSETERCHLSSIVTGTPFKSG